jgi:hypothetical protein
MTIQSRVARALHSIIELGFSVDHICVNDRVVAIRPVRIKEGRTGRYNLSFSDVGIDLREEPGGDTIRNVAERDVYPLTRNFLEGQRVKWVADQFDLEINQAERWCWVVKRTPTRVRVSYEMPNAGEMAGWYGHTQVGEQHYIAKL